MPRPTQKDVANRAGVSRTTVSYVLNDQIDKKVPISSETRQRVLDAIIELGYEPDARAQALRRGSTNAIGVLLSFQQNPFRWELVQGMAAQAQASGYTLEIVQLQRDDSNFQEAIRQLTQNRVCGLVFWMSVKDFDSAIAKQLNEFALPWVEISPVHSQVDQVIHEYSVGTRLIIDHLFALGHRRIGFVYGVREYVEGQDRLHAYEKALPALGIAIDEHLIERCGETLEDGYQATRNLLCLPNRPTALLVINDLLATAAIRAAVDLGLRVPGDVSIASFDDIPFASYSVPRLTTISAQTFQSGRDVVTLLLGRITDPNAPRQVIVAKTQLVVRESTGPVPIMVMAASAST